MLDKVLADAAVSCGAELRENFVVEELVFDGPTAVGIRGRASSGARITERARIVIGADGQRSLVAKAVDAPVYNAVPSLTCAYYSYWSGVAIDGAEICPRPGRAVIAFPTHDDLVCVFVLCAAAEAAAFRQDIERNYLAALDLVPALAERVRAARRAEPFRGTAHLPNFFRKPYGPGWALVGDAGLHRDPITAQGIADAFRDAELISDALDAALSRGQPVDAALARYQLLRDASAGPIFQMTCELAALAPPPPEKQQLFAALRANQPETDRFIGTIIGTVPIPEFFAPDNIRRIIAAEAAA